VTYHDRLQPVDQFLDRLARMIDHRAADGNQLVRISCGDLPQAGD
jgi:hypothetical protein